MCAELAQLGRTPQGSDSLQLVDHALGAQAALPCVRGAWDRVWFKGGSLSSSSSTLSVLAYAWLLQDTGKDAYVVMAMANDPNGAINVYKVQSVASRIVELVAALP